MLTTYGGKEETTKAKEKAKATTKEAKAKASTGAKDTTSQDPKDMDQAKGYKGQGNYSKAKGKGSNNYMTRHRCGKRGHWAQDCRAPVWHIGEGEELHPLEQEQADTWDWYYEGEEGPHEEENWNDYDYDKSWDWNDNSYEDTANYIGGINKSHLTIGHIRQAKSLLYKHKSKSLLGKKTTHTTSWSDHSKSLQQFLQEDTTQLHFDIAAATQQQRNKKIEDTITHYIMYSNFKSYHHLLIDSGEQHQRPHQQGEAHNHNG